MTTTPAFVTQEATVDDSRSKCPYAGVAFEPGETIAICNSCGTKHLFESWEENRGCATYGCENAPDFRKDRSTTHSVNVEAPATPANAPSRPIPPPQSTVAIQLPAWLPSVTEMRIILTYIGFVTGLVGMASPSYWGSGIGLAVSGLAVWLNVTNKDSRMVAYAAIGVVAAVLGFIFRALHAAL